MATVDIEQRIEALSEAVVFLEPTELNALADFHGQLEEVQEWATARGNVRSAAAVVAARDLIEKIILAECDDPDRSVAAIGETISGLQRLVRDGINDEQIDFPPELGVGRGTPKTSIDAAAAPHDDAGETRRFTVDLPAYVDEAIFSEFLARQDSVLEEIETALLEMESGPNEQAHRTVARHLHTLKGETALLGLSDIEHLVHAAEDLLDNSSTAGVVDPLLRLKDWLKQAFDACAGKGGAPPAPEAMLNILRGAPSAPDSATAPPPPVDISSGEVAQPPAPAVPSPPADEAAQRLTGDRELIADFVIEANEHLENCDVQLLTLEVDPHNQQAIDAVFRAFHTIKGVCGFIDLTDIQALAHESENLLDRARKGDTALVGPFLDIVFDAIDMLKRLLQHVRRALENNAPLATDPGLSSLIQAINDLVHGRPVTTWQHGSGMVGCADLASQVAEELGDTGDEARVGDILLHMGAVDEASLEQAAEAQREGVEPTPPNGNGSKASPERPPFGEALVRQGNADARDVAHALRVQKTLRATDEPATGTALPLDPAAEGSGIAVRDTVKVDAVRLDQLVDMIGELVIAESMVCQSRELVGNLSTELSRHVSQLDKITRELQEMAMGLRMVPVRSTFQKMARLVRDVARKTGKEVNFTTQGEETELDKTVVDRISDPLVHMIRNAVDHGLEASGEERRAAGKATAGNVTLRAFHSGGNIQIEISDDGKGLDRETILRKARERGLIADNGDTMADKDVWQLIFEPGFSTAKQLTEVSGRGVGMDVVRRNIEELRGEIDIHSEPGLGSCFTIRLPLTLAIIDGMVIRTGTERFIIPTLSIVVSVRPLPKDLGTVVGAAETMRLQGEIVPLFRLYELFDLSGAITTPTEGTVVVLENGGKRVGLLIDEILGQQQIVIKSLGASLRGTKGIAGGAIMPDGRVGLIIDVGELIKLATDAVSV